MKAVHYLIWLIFALFVATVLYFRGHPGLFANDTPFAFIKYLIWVVFTVFTAYTYYCSSKENFFKSCKKMADLHWGRQVGIDLYLGIFLFLFVVYLHEASIFVILMWLVPSIVYGNLATLLYLAVHFDALVARFL